MKVLISKLQHSNNTFYKTKMACMYSNLWKCHHKINIFSSTSIKLETSLSFNIFIIGGTKCTDEIRKLIFCCDAWCMCNDIKTHDFQLQQTTWKKTKMAPRQQRQGNVIKSFILWTHHIKVKGTTLSNRIISIVKITFYWEKRNFIVVIESVSKQFVM